MKEDDFFLQISLPILRRMSATTHAVGLQGPKRRVVFVTLYEIIAIIVSTSETEIS